MTTTQDWRALPAGRELDALVAERVMGATWWRSSSTGHRALFLEKPPEWFTALADGTERRVGDWPNYGGFPTYSTDIAAAWPVMEWMIARGLRPSLCLWEDGSWICDGHWDDLHGDQSAATPELAIVRAALAYVESQP